MDRNCPDAFFVFTWCFALDSENIPPPRESALYRDTVANIARKETSAIARNIILFSLLVEEEEELLLLLLLFDEKEKTPPIVVLFFFFSSIGRRFCANDVRVGVRVYLSGFFLPFFSREMLQNINRERERERCLCDAEARRPQPRRPLARFHHLLLLLANSPFSSRAKQNDAPLSRRRRRIRFSLSGIFFFEEISPGKRKWIKRLPFLPLLLRVLTRRRRPRLRPKTR
jgi:hypothetical protein